MCGYVGFTDHRVADEKKKIIKPMMDRIIQRVEQDPFYRTGLEASNTGSQATTPDAICSALRRVAALLGPAATITYTSSGFTGLRAARALQRRGVRV